MSLNNHYQYTCIFKNVQTANFIKYLFIIMIIANRVTPDETIIKYAPVPIVKFARYDFLINKVPHNQYFLYLPIQLIFVLLVYNSQTTLRH